MKVRDRLKLQIRKDLLLVLLFGILSMISLSWLNHMPQIFVFLVGGLLWFSVEAILLWIKCRKTDSHLDEIVADLVTVREINESSIILEGRNPVFWSDVDEIRKVYRAVGSLVVIALPAMSPAATRRFFYVIHLRDGKWLQLSNISIMSFGGSFKKGLGRSSDAASFLKQLLTEAGKQPHVRLICHNETMARSEDLDLKKEMQYLEELQKS